MVRAKDAVVSNALAMPKSPNRIRPEALKKMFWDLTSER